MKTHTTTKGYIALITVILISASLLTTVVAVSFQGFFSRIHILESEQKEQSAYLAESCINTAILKIAQDVDYLQNTSETITVGDKTCEIVSVTNGLVFVSNRLIKAQGHFKEAFTNLAVEINPASLPSVAIVSWNEVARF